jgi:2-C-methyl-D-erythritol 2,4-cyclodiphosphate synthase
VNIDATVVAEEPRLQQYIKEMRQNFSHALGIDVNKVSVKASTNNGLGDIGRGKGIAAYAVVIIEEGKK